MESDIKIYSQGLSLVTREKIKQMGREETGLTNTVLSHSPRYRDEQNQSVLMQSL